MRKRVVGVGVDLHSGVSDIQLSLQDIGLSTTALVISYEWPKLLYEVTDLFEKEIKERKVNDIYTAIMALKLEFEKSRSNILHTPKGLIQISLPVSVQTNR